MFFVDETIEFFYSQSWDHFDEFSVFFLVTILQKRAMEKELVTKTHTTGCLSSFLMESALQKNTMSQVYYHSKQ